MLKGLLIILLMLVAAVLIANWAAGDWFEDDGI